MNLLISSIGIRVKIVQFFKKALGDKGKVYTAACDNTSPGLYIANKGFLLPKVSSPNYVSELLKLCSSYNVKAVIPLIDLELEVLCKNIQKFKDIGVELIVSNPDVIKVTNNKFETFKFFKQNNIPTAQVWKLDKIDQDFQGYPIIAKPVNGSGSQGIVICHNYNDLNNLKQNQEEYLIQEYLKGFETTLDILADFEGNCLSIVPRKRLKVRSGEVERAVTIYNEDLIYWGQIICEKLKPKGPINVQCFICNNSIKFFEINARFAAGYPLSYHAGANFPKLIVDMLLGETPPNLIGKYERNLVMMRYDEEIIMKENTLY